MLKVREARSRSWRNSLITAVVLVMAIPVPTAATVAPDVLAAAIAERRTYGLDARESTTIQILTSGRDAGTSKWGIPMTADELATVDLEGRMDFANAVSRQLLPWAEAEPGYAGAYFDQADGGRLTILFTELNDTISNGVAARTPTDSRGISLAAATVGYDKLTSAVTAIHDIWPTLVRDVPLYVAAVDVRTNSMRVEVPAGELAYVESRLARLSQELGVPVYARQGFPEVPSVCSSRTNCHSPMKAGIRVYKTTGGGCTMGFHVVKNGDYQWLTSGHCGYSGGNTWAHAGYGNIGSETASVYHHLGDDLMWVNMVNSGQHSDDIYAASTNIAAMAAPITGEPVCASLGYSPVGVDCGTVSDNFLTYTMPGDYGGYTVYGADADGISIQGGDSGSPVYRDLVGDIAIGLISTVGGKFARITDVLPGSGWNVVT